MSYRIAPTQEFKSKSSLRYRVYAISRFVSGFGAISCYLMAWHLMLEILKKDTKVFGDCSAITYFSVMGNFLSIAFALGEASSKLRSFPQDLFTHYLL